MTDTGRNLSQLWSTNKVTTVEDDKFITVMNSHLRSTTTDYRRIAVHSVFPLVQSVVNQYKTHQIHKP